MDETLSAALDHLRRFRATFNAGDHVDEESGLTADDLDAILAAIEPPADLESGGSLSIDDLGDVA
ncbi:hypothetical protein GGQ80_003214 [Sphingomonas jinjuensis]|uniref:Uncharacterized protein n=1 Tax=Sphingomonas jinjuensis TaxID=535907 RepID=A0A840FHW1_9SPHN|nr:hypothetical protein [Sphingomonas jinjuensis]MBB4155294.1 hypothetical protein [Sphingomonas jinjuensis]